MPWIAVFDTNIHISARLSLSGKPGQCIDLARAGLVESITCQEILDEFRVKLESKFQRLPETARAAVAEIRAFSRMVTITNTLKVIEADPKDNMVIECAVVGGATHIVTGDKRHLLPLGHYQDIAIVTAADFLNLVSPQ